MWNFWRMEVLWTDSDGNEIGLMERGDFVENEGKNINSYVFADLNL